MGGCFTAARFLRVKYDPPAPYPLPHITTKNDAPLKTAIDRAKFYKFILNDPTPRQPPDNYPKIPYATWIFQYRPTAKRKSKTNL